MPRGHTDLGKKCPFVFLKLHRLADKREEKEDEGEQKEGEGEKTHG